VTTKAAIDEDAEIAISSLESGAVTEPSERRRLGNVIRDYFERLSASRIDATDKLQTIAEGIMKEAVRPRDARVEILHGEEDLVEVRVTESDLPWIEDLFRASSGDQGLTMRVRPDGSGWAMVIVPEDGADVEEDDVVMRNVRGVAFELLGADDVDVDHGGLVLAARAEFTFEIELPPETDQDGQA
jgi:hypothetical protein